MYENTDSTTLQKLRQGTGWGIAIGIVLIISNITANC
jgi:hypothetical protein